MALIVGIAGKAGSGKDTLAKALVLAGGFEKRSFAAPLKARVAEDFGWNLARLEDLDYKEEIPLLPSGLPQCPGPNGEGLTRRQVLVRIGTDGYRWCDPDFWVNKAMREVGEFDRLVYPDVRFVNEARGIKEAGGIIVRIIRIGGPTDVCSTANSSSEMEMEQIRENVNARIVWGDLEAFNHLADFVTRAAENPRSWYLSTDSVHFWEKGKW